MLFTLVGLVTVTASGVGGPTGTTAADHALEPRLAMLTGLKCSVCHVNRTGGGARTAFGAAYGQTQLPARTEGYPFRNRALNDWISVGANVRVVGSAAVTDATPQTSIETERANVYLEARLIPDRLAIYADEKLGPGQAGAREVFGLVESLPLNGYAKFGKFLPPFGLRIVDDLAFTRDVTGFNFQTPDQGVEVGVEPGPLSVFVAVSNGSGGAAEGDDQKQVTGSAVWVSRRVRLGASASRNRLGTNTRDVLGAYGGFNIGTFSLTGEVDRVRDRQGVSDRRQVVVYGAGNLLLRRGVNARVTYGYHDRDTDVPEDQRVRIRVGLEVFPIPLLQASAYLTVLDDIPQAPAQQDRVSMELHFFF